MGEPDPALRPLVDVFAAQVAAVLDIWLPDGDVVLERLEAGAAVRRFVPTAR